MGRSSRGLVLGALVALCGAADPTAFSQLQCQDSQCQRCDVFIFPANHCVEAQKGLYAIGRCNMVRKVLRQQIWSASTCSGTPLSDTEVPLNQCVQSVDQTTWFEDVCSNSALALTLRSGNTTGANRTGAHPLPRLLLAR
eukprot:TRINITY_DN13318_c0_g1_i1.p1 TRINITY_DN13318_c0_g1~~TRINITY_DN13318_c0_g1_i1.p1  ORF type:complete len:140 (+),score=14.85 TRINITY_DN13318_c0_g1_i1:78-497(+)